jgi:predicted TIM-barrel fold metal-dependent hydrolase
MPITGDFEAYLTDDWYGHPITVKSLLECEAEAGFDYAVVMPQTKEVPDNDRLVAETADNPHTLPCVLIDPRLGSEAIDALEGLVEKGALGMKLMGAIHKYEIDDPMVFPFVDKAAELGMVISIHSGSRNCSADRIGVLAKRVPDSPVIIDHMGYSDNFDDAMQVCRDHPNTYMGTTDLRFHKRWANSPEETIPDGVKIAVDEIGPERVVFGSNLPEYRPIQVKRAIQRLELGKEAEELIFGGNLGRIYGLK